MSKKITKLKMKNEKQHPTLQFTVRLTFQIVFVDQSSALTIIILSLEFFFVSEPG